MTKGDTFYWDHGRSSSHPHLYVILSDPAPPDERVLVANFTEFVHKGRSDNSCVIQPGECGYRFFVKLSCVAYSRATDKWTVPSLEHAILYGDIEAGEPLPEQLLKRVQDGVELSDAIRERLRKYQAYF